MQRRSLALLLVVFLSLGGCSSGEETTVPAGMELQRVDASGVALDKPAAWDFLTRTESPLDFPPNVILLLRDVEPWGTQGLFPTVAVAREEVPAGTSTKKYAEAAILETEKEILNYEEMGKEEVTVSGEGAVLLHFSGRNSAEDERMEWYHLFLVEGDTGYVVSSSAPLDASEEQKNLLRQIVLSFRFEPK